MSQFIELSSAIFVFLTKYYLGDQTKEDEMGSAYGNMGENRNAYGILVRNP